MKVQISILLRNIKKAAKCKNFGKDKFFLNSIESFLHYADPTFRLVKMMGLIL